MRCMFCGKPVGEDGAEDFITDDNEGIACVSCGTAEIETQKNEGRRQMTEAEVNVLSMLEHNGPLRFRAAADLTACETLYRDGLIADYRASRAMRITPKGRRVLADAH